MANQHTLTIPLSQATERQLPWGLRGRFRITWDTLAELLAQQGDALQPA